MSTIEERYSADGMQLDVTYRCLSGNIVGHRVMERLHHDYESEQSLTYISGIRTPHTDGAPRTSRRDPPSHPSRAHTGMHGATSGNRGIGTDANASDRCRHTSITHTAIRASKPKCRPAPDRSPGDTNRRTQGTDSHTKPTPCQMQGAEPHQECRMGWLSRSQEKDPHDSTYHHAARRNVVVPRQSQQPREPIHHIEPRRGARRQRRHEHRHAERYRRPDAPAHARHVVPPQNR